MLHTVMTENTQIIDSRMPEHLDILAGKIFYMNQLKDNFYMNLEL